MDLKPNQSLPFLTRPMLNFGHGMQFSLRISVQSFTNNPLTIRGMTREGVFTLRHICVNDGLLESEVYELPDFPIWVSVSDEDQDFLQGDCFVTLSVLANGDKLFELCSGFVYGQRSINFPSNNSSDVIPGHGTIRQIAGSAPAVGAEISDTVPAGRMWHILAMGFQLVTAASVGSRRVHVAFSNGTSLALQCIADTTQIISLTRHYSVGQYGVLPLTNSGTEILIPMPADIYLDAGSSIETVTDALAAGDQYGGTSYLVEQFFNQVA